MSKYTPGPWYAVPYGDGDDTVICKDEAGNHRISFMAIPGCRDQRERQRTFAEIKANARLIAAAPTLLDELAKFAAKANRYDGVPPPKYFGDIDCELHYPDSLKIEFTLGELRAARAAIAAATGEV